MHISPIQKLFKKFFRFLLQMKRDKFIIGRKLKSLNTMYCNIQLFSLNTFHMYRFNRFYFPFLSIFIWAKKIVLLLTKYFMRISLKSKKYLKIRRMHSLFVDCHWPDIQKRSLNFIGYHSYLYDILCGHVLNVFCQIRSPTM